MANNIDFEFAMKIAITILWDTPTPLSRNRAFSRNKVLKIAITILWDASLDPITEEDGPEGVVASWKAQPIRADLPGAKKGVAWSFGGPVGAGVVVGWGPAEHCV